MKSSKTKKLALCAMGGALSFVLLYLGTVTAVFDMSAAVLCGVITVFLAAEAGSRMSACAVAVCAILSAALLPDKTVCVLYVTIGGIYPLIKPLAEKFGKIRMWALKLAAAWVSIGLYVGSIYIFLPSETGRWLIPGAFVLGTACFILYDVLLTRFYIIYIRRFRGKFIK